MSKYIITMLISALWITPIEAKPVLTVTCSEPKGTRYDYGKRPGETNVKLRKRKDSFTEVKPVFVMDDTKPKTMLVIWSSTRSLTKPKAKEAMIVHQTVNQISAVEPYENGVWLHSLYPKLGIGYFTRHTTQWFGESSAGNIFHSSCEFAQ